MGCYKICEFKSKIKIFTKIKKNEDKNRIEFDINTNTQIYNIYHLFKIMNELFGIEIL